MRRPLLLLALVATSACVTTPDPPRYFRPQAPARAEAAEERGASGAAALASDSPRLTLARIEAAEHLGERIVRRRSEVEFGFYDPERWTEPPARFLELAIARELFSRRGLRHAERGAPELQLRLLALEEILLPQHRARVRVWLRLVDPLREARLERWVEAEVPVAEEAAPALARALGVALDEVVREIADAVTRALPLRERE